MIVRRAEQEDAAAIADLAAVALDAAWDASAYRAELGSSVARVWVAEDASGVVAGFVHVWEVAGETEIVNVATARAARRQGVARSLLETALDHARVAGCTRAVLEVREHNHAARALYAALGFEICARRSAYYADGADALVLACGLVPG